MKQSDLFSINWRDVLRALVIAALTPVLFALEKALTNGAQYTLQEYGYMAAAGAVAYLVKNFLTKPDVK